MRPWLAMVFCLLLDWGLGFHPAWAACAGPPHDQFDFWLGAWHDPASPPAEHYAVRRTAGGCAIEEVLTGGNGRIQGIGVSGWDSERKQWRQLWADRDGIVTVYMGGPAANGTFILTSEPKGGGTRWRTRTGTSGPTASTPNMPRAAATTDRGRRCGRVTSIGSDRRDNNGFGSSRGLIASGTRGWSDRPRPCLRRSRWRSRCRMEILPHRNDRIVS